MEEARTLSVAITLAIALGLASTSALSAQDAPAAAASVVPPLIKFNGVIATPGTTNRVGDTASTRQVTATFSLYELQEGGSPLWSESQKVQLDEQGHYIVLLGATSSAGLPLDLFASGKALWLGVQPQLSGAGELPRVLLVAVPYALKASDSDTLGGKPASAYALAGAPAVVELAGVSAPPSATSNPSAPGNTVEAAVGKDFTVQPLTACSAITSDGTATANAVAKFTTACNVENSLIRDNGTGVVVGGTAVPGALLDVQFNSTATSGTIFGQRVLSTLNPAAASSVQASGFYSDALTKSGNAQNITGSLFAAVLEADHYGTGTLTQAYGMNDNVLNRGTGTITNAYGILSTVSNASTGKIINGDGVYVTPPGNATGGTFSNYSGVYISSPSAIAGAYGLYSGGGKNYFAGDVGIGTTTPAANLEVNGTAKFDGAVTFAGGNVGIGTTTPAANLEVNGTAKFDGAVTFAGTDTITGKQLISTVATGTAPLTVSSTTMVPNLNAALLGGLAASAFQPVGSYATLAANTFTGNQTVKGYVAAYGDTRVDFNNLNTGTNTPALRFGSGSTGEGIGSDRVGTVNVKGLDFYTNAMPRMSVTNAGYMGIGTATPGAFLDVEGGTSTSGVGGGVWTVGQTGLLSHAGGAIVLRAGPGGYNGTEDSVGGSGGNININGGNAGLGEVCCGNAGSVTITGGTGGIVAPPTGGETAAGGRGRDSGCPLPPAQIRTCAG